MSENLPASDPAPIFDIFRGNFATELLTAAVAHFGVFGRLAAQGPTQFEDLRVALGLDSRPMQVLVTALQAMGLLREQAGAIDLTELARTHLVPGGEFDVGDYVGLMADHPGVKGMVERLQTNRPAGSDDEGGPGVAYIYRDGIVSAMDQHASARHFTLALAARARNVAPVLASNYPLPQAKRLLDVGGGSGLYAIAYLRANPSLEAIVWDRPEVLRVAAELASSHGVEHRLKLVAGDMFADPVPENCDVHLVSNILHDWDVPECNQLLKRLAQALPPHGQLLIHDVFLNDTLDGPLPIALYSAALFSLTEGRAYSAREYRSWLEEVGLQPANTIVPTLVSCGVLAARKSG